MHYSAPVADLLHTLRYATSGSAGSVPELADGTAEAVLREAALMAEQVLAPLDAVGDRVGLHLSEGHVRTPPGWVDGYRTWTDGGWNGVTAPERFGGMALPQPIGAACAEIWSGANLSFGLAPLLTAGAIDALAAHGAPALQALYLPKLVAGTWTGTMNLTEPHAGSDLGALRTRAERAPDGSYLVKGQKIFITFGEHDLTENIIHLVLARLPDGPAGTRGLSLFLVPKRLLDQDGNPGAPNDLRCTGLERKLGMHAAPTCTMVFGDNGGARGFLVGEEHKGLACMFTMMNSARLAVGLEGVAAADHATQLATAYARERRQGRRDARAADMTPIIEHPDVARMLMTMRVSTDAARAICFLTAVALDRARLDPDPVRRRAAAARAALLTPVAKAFSTDVGTEVASLGVQVHGGLGYIEDAGAAQILRDVRITPIYEGTNGIQAIDLATRKLPLEDGAVLAREIEDMRGVLDVLTVSNRPAFGDTKARLSGAIDSFERTSTALHRLLSSDPIEVLAGASSYLRMFGLVRGAASLCAMALLPDADEAERASDLRVVRARFFADRLLPEVAALEQVVLGGAGTLRNDPAAWSDAL